MTAAVAPEASTSQPSISLGAVLSVFAVLIAVVAGAIGVYLPVKNYLNEQQIKANEAEARQYLSSMYRVQGAYYLEHGIFLASIEKLKKYINIETETENYTYYTRYPTVSIPGFVPVKDNQTGSVLLKRIKDKSSNSPSSYHYQVVNYAISRQDNLRSYVGFVFMILSNGTDYEEMIYFLLCQADNPGTIYPAIPNDETGHLACAPGTSEVK